MASVGLSPRNKLAKQRSMKTMATRTTDGNESILLGLTNCLSVQTTASNDCGSETGRQARNTGCEATVASTQVERSDRKLRPAALDFIPAMVGCMDSPRSTGPALADISPPKYPFAVGDGQRTEGKALGRLKFFNEAKEYGFIIMDDESEIFVHKADLIKQSIDTRYLAYYKKYYDILMEFNVQEYQGKSKKHRKAVDVMIFDMQALC